MSYGLISTIVLHVLAKRQVVLLKLKHSICCQGQRGRYEKLRLGQRCWIGVGHSYKYLMYLGLYQLLLNYIMPLVSFCTPRKHQGKLLFFRCFRGD